MTRRLAPALFGLALVPLLGFAGCDDDVRACTLIGCDSALLVSLEPAGGALPDGRYEVRATAGGEARSCSFTAAPCADGTCFSDVGEGCLSLYSLDGEPLTVGLAPIRGEVSVAVTRDGAAVGSGAVVPAYEPQYLNGPDCGVTCETARATVAVE